MSSALTERLGDTFDLTVFDPNLRSIRKAARGTPYLTDGTHPLLNAPARMMSVRTDDPDHFKRWHEIRQGDHGDRDVYVTRPLFGAYLSDVFRGVRHSWGDAQSLLHCVPEEVVDLREDAEGRYTVSTPNADFRRFDHVVLCLGWGSDSAEPSVYPLEDTIDRVLGGNSVGVIGTGLAAIDVVRALFLSGYSGTVHMASRRGVLPAIRSAHPEVTPVVFTRSRLKTTDQLTVREAIRLVALEADAQDIDLSVPLQ